MGKFTTQEMADKLNVCQPSIWKYLSQLKDQDNRFLKIKQGLGIKRKPIKQEFRDNITQKLRDLEKK